MKKIILGSIVLGLFALAAHQSYLTYMGSYAPDIAINNGALFVQGANDGDHDGVDDLFDNCVGTYNPSQTDSDRDNQGDACDSSSGSSNGSTGSGNTGGDACDGKGGDGDHDGICDLSDNCVGTYNPSQKDSNNNNQGDACDTPTQPTQPKECTSGQTRSCGLSTGMCRTGKEKCVNGNWDGICRDDIGPRTETCDNKDNDCDGSVDEGLNCNPSVHGKCGYDYGTCTSGSSKNLRNTSCGSDDTWSCAGSNGGSTASCSISDECPIALPKPGPSPIHGQCGRSFGSCTSGNASNKNNTSCGSDDTRVCTGKNNGSTDYCRVTDQCAAPVYQPSPRNGSCGASFGSCNRGISSNKVNSPCGVDDIWTCLGTNNGSADYCRVTDVCKVTPLPKPGPAPIVIPKPIPTPIPTPTPIPGICGNGFGSCTSGNASNERNTACGQDDTWVCEGTFGGQTAYCNSVDVCPIIPVHGDCGSYFGSCTTGVVSQTQDTICGQSDTRTCVGSKGGSTDYCSIPDVCPIVPVDGKCGSTLGSCRVGAVTQVRDTTCGQEDTWTCAGSKGGSSDYCSVPDVCPDPCLGYGGDTDGDTICDTRDNCPEKYNIDQSNTFGDIRGDACEDEVIVLECAHGQTRPCGNGSNVGECMRGVEVCQHGYWSGVCQDEVGPKQDICDGRDNDCDGIVDEDNICDPCAKRGLDLDHDGICGYDDNCPSVSNPNQADHNGYLDHSGDGDACEKIPVKPVAYVPKPQHRCPDSDKDGVCDAEDHCPQTFGLVTNYGCSGVAYTIYSQQQTACANLGGDTDRDGICNYEDVCPNMFGSSSNNGCAGQNACPYGYEDDGRGGCGHTYQYNTASYGDNTNRGGGTTKSGYVCKTGTRPNGLGGCATPDDPIWKIREGYIDNSNNNNGYICQPGFAPNGVGGCMQIKGGDWY